MAPSTRRETISMPDGAEMGAYVAIPETGSGAGVLVLMEIFGVGTYIRRATERLAELGYVALAPDLYRRIDPGLELDHDEDGLNAAMAAVGRLDQEGAVEDSVTALEHLRGLPEVSGQVGVLGFCLGGSLAFGVAASSEPAAAVSYYGSGVPDALAQADQITCPIIFHFGADDPFISSDQVELVEQAARQRPSWEFHRHPGAGHAFDNHDAPQFHQPDAAAVAWEQTRAFLAREL
jgi:carboxymethylenebutenolidase